jgi:hypothetical protein
MYRYSRRTGGPAERRDDTCFYPVGQWEHVLTAAQFGDVLRRAPSSPTEELAECREVVGDPAKQAGKTSIASNLGHSDVFDQLAGTGSGETDTTDSLQLARSNSRTTAEQHISRYNGDYFCEVKGLQVSSAGVASVSFCVRGNGKLGALQDPAQSTLFRLSGDSIVEKFSVSSSEISTQTSTEIVGVLSYLVGTHGAGRFGFAYGGGGVGGYSMADLSSYSGTLSSVEGAHFGEAGAGADASRPTREGKTAAEWARERGHPAVAKLIEDHLAAPKAAAQKKAAPKKPASAAAGPAAIPLGWAVHTDPKTGKTFYYHAGSGQTQWDIPL